MNVMVLIFTPRRKDQHMIFVYYKVKTRRIYLHGKEMTTVKEESFNRVFHGVALFQSPENLMEYLALEHKVEQDCIVLCNIQEFKGFFNKPDI